MSSMLSIVRMFPGDIGIDDEPIRESRLTLATPGSLHHAETGCAAKHPAARRSSGRGGMLSRAQADTWAHGREMEPAMPPRGRASHPGARHRCGPTALRPSERPLDAKEQRALVDRLGEEAARTPLERGCPQMLLWKCREEYDGNPGLDIGQTALQLD